MGPTLPSGGVPARAGGLPGSVEFDKAELYEPLIIQTLSFLEKTMWTKPEFTEMRFGFEVTMYIANR